MKLVYDRNGVEVQIGDVVTLRDGETVTVTYITKPHKPSSTGRVGVQELRLEGGEDWTMSYFPNVIGATWIEREDRC